MTFMKNSDCINKQEEEEESNLHKLRLPVSNKKTRKYSDAFQAPKEKQLEKSTSKSRVGLRNDPSKSDRKDNKENEYSKNMSNMPETRGVKRKLKVFNIRDEE
jgi:hypothetical protein